MGDTSSIEWTDATWNPVVGCTRVSAGCDHCYAFREHDRRHLAYKRGRWPDAPAQYHHPFSRVQLLPDRLAQPLRWRKPRRVFVNSLSDLLHKDVPDDYIDRVFAVMALTPRHTYQILTKRPERMAAYMSRLMRLAPYLTDTDERSFGGRRWESGEAFPPLPLPNVWLGVSVENQATADERIPHLLATPAAVRFLSCEPLLGPVNPWAFECPGDPCLCHKRIDWVIVGGESGPHARPMHPEWVRSLRDQCVDSGVSFFFKQWGEWAPGGFSEDASFMRGGRGIRSMGGGMVSEEFAAVSARWHRFPDGFWMQRIGKRAAGRRLDGWQWEGLPAKEVAS